MKLVPYESVDGLGFDASPDFVIGRLGVPHVRSRNGIGLDEFDYGERVLRFQDGGRLEEVTVRADALHLPEVVVPFAMLAGFVRAQDEGTFRVGGFYVSPRFGIAFDPADSNWITALASHCLPQWRALISGTAPQEE